MVYGCLWLNKISSRAFLEKTSLLHIFMGPQNTTKKLNTTKSQIDTVKGVATAGSLSEAGLGARGDPWRALSGKKSHSNKSKISQACI